MERIRLAKVKLTYTDLTKTSKELTEYLRTVLKVKEVQHIITYKNKDETTSLISLKKNLTYYLIQLDPLPIKPSQKKNI